MSLQISANGTREGVLRHLDSVKFEEGKPIHGTDASQVAAVKAFVESEISSLKPEVNGLRLHVEASAHEGNRMIQIQIVPQKLHV